MPELDTLNRFLVTMHAENIRVMNPPAGTITKAEAVMLAAWLVALADPGREQFDKSLDAVLNT